MFLNRLAKITAFGSLSTLCLFGLVACGSGGASNAGSGGATATGGSGTSTGGSTGSGGSMGSGGKVGSGGSTGSGGTTASGGATASGGSKGTGGASASGGLTGSGGTTSSGGTTATGGVSASGGTTATGGTAAGGQSGTGGAAAGGSKGSGGASSGGGTSGGGCIICDDFESGTTLDAAKWVIDTSQGAAAGKVEIVSGGAHGSGKAAKASGGYIKVAAATGLFSTVPLHFFMRVNMKFDMAQPSGHVTYMMLDDKTKMGELRIGAQNGGMIWNYSTTDSILPDYNAAAMSLSPPANEWHCFEFEIDGNAPAMHVWMDGTESMQMLLDSTATSGIDDRWMRDMPGWKPDITNFAFGEGYPAGSISTWFDDIAISASRVGCTF